MHKQYAHREVKQKKRLEKMRQPEKWMPSKYVYRNGKLSASRNPMEVGVGSRLIADLIAGCYEDTLPRHARGRLLDLGCGKVPLYALYRDYVTDNVCVDWQSTFHNSAHLDCESDLSRDLPFKDEEFDTIILSDVLEHIQNPEHLCMEMARVLATGGKILMNVPFFYRLHEMPHDYFRYTEYGLRQLMDNSGLSLVLLDPIGGVPEIMTDIFAKTVCHIPLVGHAIAAFSQWSTRFFIRTSLGTKISEETKKVFPLAYFLVAEKPCGAIF